MSIMVVIILGVAFLLIYGAVKNQHPVDVVKHALDKSVTIRPLAG